MEAVAGLFAAAGTAAAGSAAAGTTAAATAAAATSTAAWAAGTTVTAAATTSTVWSILQGAATVASVAASLGGGVLALAEGNRAGLLSEVEAGQQRVASEQRANAIKREWLERTGAARVAFAASGVDIGAGSPAAVEDTYAQQMANATGIERENAVLRELNALARGDAERGRGLAGLVAGVGRAGGTAASYGIDIRTRG